MQLLFLCVCVHVRVCLHPQQFAIFLNVFADLKLALKAEFASEEIKPANILEGLSVASKHLDISLRKEHIANVLLSLSSLSLLWFGLGLSRKNTWLPY